MIPLWATLWVCISIKPLQLLWLLFPVPLLLFSVFSIAFRKIHFEMDFSEGKMHEANYISKWEVQEAIVKEVQKVLAGFGSCFFIVPAFISEFPYFPEKNYKPYLRVYLFSPTCSFLRKVSFKFIGLTILWPKYGFTIYGRIEDWYQHSLINTF